MIKVIVIDMGGVCFELGTDRAVEKMYCLIDAPKEKIDEIFKGGHHRQEGYLYRRGKITHREFWDAAIRKLGIRPELAPKLEEIWHSSYVPVKGMLELIRELSRSYKLVVFSGNIRERVEFLERKHDFKRYFQDFVWSFDHGFSKEDIEFYDALVSRLDCRPEEAVVIDDVPQFIDMAKSKGLKTIQFESAEQLRAELRKLGVRI